MTYKEIINRFRTVVENHLQLKDFGYGELSDLKTQSQLGPEEQGVDYPYLFLLPAPSVRQGPVMEYSFNMVVMDMARTEEGDLYDNYITIQSQCQQYIDDVLANLYYYYKDQPEIQLTNITYTPFKEKYQDELAGMTATITIQVPTPLNNCITPIEVVELYQEYNAESSTSYGTLDNEDIIYRWIDDTIPYDQNYRIEVDLTYDQIKLIEPVIEGGPSVYLFRSGVVNEAIIPFEDTIATDKTIKFTVDFYLPPKWGLQNYLILNFGKPFTTVAVADCFENVAGTVKLYTID